MTETAIKDGVAYEGDLDPEPIQVSEANERHAEEFEKRCHERATVQFQRLKDEARAIFGMMEGQPGIRSLANLQELIEKAGDEIGNGRFIVRCLGAERYLDAGTVAVLLTFRQNLIAEIDQPTAADIMMIDTAVVAYYNFVRTQGWIGNLSLAFEREAFGQAPLNEVHGPTAGERLRDDLARLSETILPLQARVHRMMVNSLERLPHAHQRRPRERTATPL